MIVPRRNDYPSGTGVPVASMIDIVFLLIIFFVVTADIDREAQDQEIVLPQISSGTPIKLKKKESLTVNLRWDGTITVDGERVSAGQLRKIMDVVKERWGGKHPIIIRGDQKVTFKHTNEIIKILSERNFANVSFNAELIGKQ